MRIKETVERDCCQARDLLPIAGTPMIGNNPAYMFCKHCGRHHYFERYNDGIDSNSRAYASLKLPWEVR